MVEMIMEFEGIIGAILGSVVTLIITDILQNRGKIKHYLMNYEALFHLLHTTDFVLHTDFTTSTSFFDSPKDFVSKLSASDSNTHPLSTE